MRVPGSTVRELVQVLERTYPGLQARLCDGDALRPGIQASVDGHFTRLGLRQPVGPDSEVHFVPALGGGH